uniref:Serrate RNA effector molecule homolog n=1 Tax=Oncorhynchus mykiss TaxID=8022 RepID=A0A8C7SE56_ONCMY
MADSDDEYDRRRRDKFRRERSDNYDRSREREDRRRDDWNDREWDRGRERRSRGEYRDYERGRRERFSPPRHDMSPQQKRMRRDWDDHGGDPYHGGYDLGYGGGGGPSYAPPQPWGHPDLHLMQPHHGIPIQARLGNIHDMDLGPPPPVMKSFKEFLLSLDDSVDETEAVKRYNEYKIDFRRQQMQDFFLAHKDEEWFRSKYHPDEAGRRKAESHSALQNRLNVYMFLMENSWFDTVSLDIEKSQAIMKVLDAGRVVGGEALGGVSNGFIHLSVGEYFAVNLRFKQCQEKYPGFMRVCLSDPQPERRFFRRCWVTFDRSVNIKETCWNLQNIRLRDCELAPGVNRDLARRVRNINGITQHKQVLRNDIKLSAKLIHSLDHRGRLWSHKSRGEAVSVAAQNPILKNITDYLIEEVSAEEEELLGSVGGADAEEGTKEGYPAEITVERDDKLVKVLDRLLLYLRIVHSIDYYNNCEYPSEDEMPNRCGMIHVVKEKLSEEEAGKMGRKDPEQEVEKFVLANTQELGKDKWLCPLSGKKFKGPEFVRKHILNKHGDKIEEVKREVMFFNNFLMDAKRPSLPEMKPPPPLGPGPGERHVAHTNRIRVLSPGMPFPPQGLMGFGPGQPRPPVMGYGGGPPYPPNQYGGGRGNYDNFRGQAGGYPGKPRNNRMSRGDPRNIIEYRDLDAPDDIDFF